MSIDTDISGLLLTGPVSGPDLLKDFSETAKASGDGSDVSVDAKKKQAAKDFESIFIYKLLEQMNDTIGDWGFEEDGAAKQIKGIFSLYLSRELADSGGFGLWKEIHEFLMKSEQKPTELLNEKI